MKLILKEYLSQLKERDELDVMLPELLSEMGLNVVSRPKRGTRQFGVDVVAISSGEEDQKKVYLFSIKGGNLTRKEWDNNTSQGLRTSLNDIIDVYIGNHIPPKYKDYKVVICLCFGGDIAEDVRQNVTGYIKAYTTDRVEFEEWNGDKLAQLIERNFLKGELLPSEFRGLFRKSLALLDEPLASYEYFRQLLENIIASDKAEAFKLRQVYLSLWILYVWCRKEKNLESAFLSAEVAVLYSWDRSKNLDKYNNKNRADIIRLINAVHKLYRIISQDFLGSLIIPYCGIEHGLSFAVRGRNHIDINLRLFDVMGRLALEIIWLSQDTQMSTNDDSQPQAAAIARLSKYFEALKTLIINNPILLAPYKEEQAIEIGLALLALSQEEDLTFIHSWLKEMTARISANFISNQTYPCILTRYEDLIEHPKREIQAYKASVTKSSVLYTFLATVAAKFQMQDVFDSIKDIHKKFIPHCNLQAWYLSENSDSVMWKNNEAHGVALTDIELNMTMADYLEKILNRCKTSQSFKKLSAVKHGCGNLVLLANRHYKYPLPYDFFVPLDSTGLQHRKQKTHCL